MVGTKDLGTYYTSLTNMPLAHDSSSVGDPEFKLIAADASPADGFRYVYVDELTSSHILLADVLEVMKHHDPPVDLALTVNGEVSSADEKATEKCSGAKADFLVVVQDSFAPGTAQDS
mmetsp:Transcript_31143/g.47617  ORF Transcript_31143/g.47617 Transcript_31143/m.47617 type:complete len:118 (-) Transcript_31143:32-385(-)